MTHANKKGVRYRYYVSHGLLQGRKADAGSVARVSAPDVEALIVNALRACDTALTIASDREAIDQRLRYVIVQADCIMITLRQTSVDEGIEDAPPLSIPFTPTLLPRKGVAHAPARNDATDDATRSALPTAIARSTQWIESMVANATIDFATIAKRE